MINAHCQLCLQLYGEIRTKCWLFAWRKARPVTAPALFWSEQEKRARINASATVFCARECASSPRAPCGLVYNKCSALQLSICQKFDPAQLLHGGSKESRVWIIVVFTSVSCKNTREQSSSCGWTRLILQGDIIYGRTRVQSLILGSATDAAPFILLTRYQGKYYTRAPETG